MMLSGDRTIKTLVAGAAAAVFSAWAGTAEAGPLLCNGGVPNPSEPAYRCETVSHTYSPGFTENLYEFDSYGSFNQFHSFTNELGFDSILRTFTLYMSAFFVTPGNAAFLARLPAGATPETFLTTDGATWIYFYVEDLQPPDCDDITQPCGEPQQGSEYGPDSVLDDDLKAWFQTVTWFSFFGTDDARMLHDPRGGPAFFGDDITVEGSFDPAPDPCDDSDYYGCEPPPPPIEVEIAKEGGPGDPLLTGTANDFSATTITSTSVPEPLTLVLVGLGAAGAVVRARRRRNTH